MRHEHVSIKPEPKLKITLNRGQKGNYGWGIQYAGEDLKAVLDEIEEADKELRERYTSDG